MKKLLAAAVLAAFTGSALMIPTVTFAASATDTQVAQAPKKDEKKKEAPKKKAPVKKKGEGKKKAEEKKS
jgi:hypothetical protein